MDFEMDLNSYWCSGNLFDFLDNIAIEHHWVC